MLKNIPLALIVLFLLMGCDNANHNLEASRHVKAANGYFEQGQYRAAVIEAQNALRIDPTSGAALHLLSNVYTAIGAYPENSEFLEKRIKQHPDLYEPLIKSYFYQNKFISALALAENFSSQNSISIDSLKYLTISALMIGDQTRANAFIEQLNQLPESESVLEFLEAYAFTLNNNIDAAERILQASLQRKASFDAVKLLSLILIGKNHLEDADKLLSDYLITLPVTDVASFERVQILTMLVDVLIGLGQTNEALAYQKLMAQANPEQFYARQDLAKVKDFIVVNDYKNAQLLLVDLLKKYPSNQQVKSIMAIVEFKLGNTQGVLSLFDSGTDPETVSANVLQAVAVTKFRNRQADDAIQMLLAASNAQPNNADILAALGLAMLSLDIKSKPGADRLEKALELKPNQPRLYAALARHQRELGENTLAKNNYKKAFSLAGNDPVVLQQYYQFLFDSGDKATLYNLLNEKGGLNKEASYHSFFYGWFLSQDKKFDDAVRIYSNALQEAKGDLKEVLLIGLAKTYEAQNKIDLALTSWESAITINPTSITSFMDWYRVASSNGFNERINNFLKQLKNSDELWIAQLIFADEAFLRRDMDSALNHIEKALLLNSHEAIVASKAISIYTLLGDAKLQSSDLSEAKRYYVKALSLAPKNIDILVKLIQADLMAGRVEEAKKFATTYVDNSERFAGHYLQSIIAFFQKDEKEGIKQLRLSWSEKPTDLVGDAIYGYFSSRDNLQLANNFLNEWLKVLPESVLGHLKKASVEEVLDDVVGAVDSYEKVLQLAPTNVIALNNLANLYLGKNKDMALSYAERAYQLEPESPAVLDTLGWILVESGEVKKGVVLLEKAVVLLPSNKDIAQHLEEAKKRL